MHLFLFFIPGILLIFSKSFNRKSLIEFFVYVVGFSLSFFVVIPWFIRYLNIPMLLSTYLVFIFSSALLLINIKKFDLKLLKIDRNEMILAGILLLVLLLRLMPVFFQIAPAGADMSMHSYITRLIYDNDGIPRSYEPLFPVSSFGAYPTGLPTLSALISQLSDSPVYRSGLLMSCLSYALICFGLYVFLLRFFDRNTSMACAIAATFLTGTPQWIVRWGGSPTVLAFFFFILALSLIIELKEIPSRLNVIFASLALAAVLITDPIVFYIGGIILVVYLLMSFTYFKNIRATAVCLFIFTLLFLLPYLANLDPVLTRSAIENIRAAQTTDLRPVFYDLATEVPFLILCIFGLPVLFNKNRQMLIVFLTITSVLFLLILNYRFRFLPFSYLIYPGYLDLALLIPLSLFAAPSISKIISIQKKYLLFSFLAIGFLFYCIFYMNNSISLCSVSQADIDAFKWMDSVLNKRAVIANNSGDAGLWIPAIIGRTITDPHCAPINSEGLKTGLNKIKPDYIYIGSKAVYGIEYKKEDLEKKPWKYRIVYIKDGAQVWKIL